MDGRFHMKEKIMECAKGKFNYEPIGLQVSDEMLQLIALPCDKLCGSIHINAIDGRVVQGMVTVDDNRVSVTPEVFRSNEIDIQYSFPAATAIKEKSISGCIHLTTNCGQKDIPYEISVANPLMHMHGKEIHTIEEFSQMVRDDISEALRIFTSDDFAKTFLGKDVANRRLYEDLLLQENKEMALEEFLISMGLKEPVEISVNRNRFELPAAEGTFLVKVGVVASTWGAIDIQVDTKGSFLKPLVRVIHTSEFIRHTYVLDLEVNCDALADGCHMGRVVLTSPYESVGVDIIVHKSEVSKQHNDNISIKRHIRRLMKYYLDFRLHQCIFADFIMGMDREIEQLKELEYPYAIFWEILIGIIAERNDEVRDNLALFNEMVEPSLSATEEEVVVYMTYLYLKAFFTKEEKDVKRAVTSIRKFYDEKYHLPILLWFLIYLDEILANPVSRLEELMLHISNGVSSPVFYYEVFRIYDKNTQMFRELTPENLRVFEWAVKNNLVSKELAVQFGFVAGRVKKYNRRVVQCLTKLYKRYGQSDVLQSLCAQLIQGDKRGEAYFTWFELGVQEKLRLTDLFEYYMYSVPESINTLPDTIISYFQYENHLTDKKKAFFYAQIVKNKDNNQSVFDSYEEQIRLFVEQSLKDQRIDANYAVLYNEFLAINKLSEEEANSIANIFCTAQLNCKQKDIVGVYVVYPQLKKETYYPLRYGRCVIKLASEHAQLHFSDRKGQRFIHTVSYRLERFFVKDSSEILIKMAKKCFELGISNDEIFLVLFERLLKSPRLSTKDVILCQMIVESGILAPHVQSQAVRILFHYYRQHKDSVMQREMIRRFDFDYIDKQYAKELLDSCIQEGAIRKAREGIAHFGFRQVDLIEIKNLCMMELHSASDDDMLLIKMCYYLVWQGIEERALLKYLAHCYTGTVNQMSAVYIKAVEHSIDVTELAERMMAQTLFIDGDSQPCQDAFVYYYESGKNRVLVKGFLSYLAYQFIVGKVDVQEEIIDIMKHESVYEDNTTILLALLKAYSQKEDLSDREKEFATLQLEKMWRLGIIMDFMKNFSGKIPLPYEIEHCEFVQGYSGSSQPMTCYAKKDGETEYTSYMMREVYQHIYIKEFLLFPGESLEYYIDEQDIHTVYGKDKQLNRDSLFALLQSDVCEYVRVEELAKSLIKPL